MPREQTCHEWLSWKLSYQSIWQLQEEKEGLGWTFPRKDECKSLCQFLPSHPRSWSVLIHLDTTGMQRSPGGQQAVAGWWHSYLACIRLSDWNSKNNNRGAKALWVAGRKWVLYPGWQGQPSLALTKQKEKGSQEWVVSGHWKLILQKRLSMLVSKHHTHSLTDF